MYEEKIETALLSALKHLADSLKALSEGSDEAVSNSLWSALSEAEYAVFVLSLVQGEKAENASWKQISSPKRIPELEPALTSALDLLKNAKTEVTSERLEKAYEKAWMARNLILDAQGLFEKKHKETKK